MATACVCQNLTLGTCDPAQAADPGPSQPKPPDTYLFKNSYTRQATTPKLFFLVIKNIAKLESSRFLHALSPSQKDFFGKVWHI